MLKFCFWIPYPTFYYNNNNNNDNNSIDKHPKIFFHCCISTLSALFLLCPMPIPLQFFGNCCISKISNYVHSLKKEAQHPKSLKMIWPPKNHGGLHGWNHLSSCPFQTCEAEASFTALASIPQVVASERAFALWVNGAVVPWRGEIGALFPYGRGWSSTQ